MGPFGDDFLRRAADWSLAGVAANSPWGGLPDQLPGRRLVPGSSLTAATSCALTPMDCAR